MTVLTPRFDEALRYAHEIHAGQERRGVPTIGHLLAVTALVLELGGTEDEAIAALLHDAAEDAGGRERVADIALHFGAEVARMVDECTDSYDQAMDWREKKEKYIAEIPRVGADSLFVSAADKLCNVRQICLTLRERGESAWNDCAGGREGRLWYYQTLVAAYAEAGEKRVTPHLIEAAREMSQF